VTLKKCSHCGKELGTHHYLVPKGADLTVVAVDRGRSRIHEYVNQYKMLLCPECIDEMANHFGFPPEGLRKRFRA
jgi:hypothetical protein